MTTFDQLFADAVQGLTEYYSALRNPEVAATLKVAVLSSFKETGDGQADYAHLRDALERELSLREGDDADEEPYPHKEEHSLERLILEYVVSDGYTYSHTTTLPIVHVSKAQAIEDLEGILLAHLLLLEGPVRDLQKDVDAKYDRMVQLKAHPREVSKLEVATKAFLEAKAAQEAFTKEHLNTFGFGGQVMAYHQFFEIDLEGKPVMAMPNIFSLDEYFSAVEKV